MRARSLLVWGPVALILVILIVLLVPGPSSESTLPQIAYSELVSRAEAGRIASVRTSGQAIALTERDGRIYLTYVPEGAMSDTIRRLVDADVRIEAERSRYGPTLGDILLSLVPMLVLIGAWFFLMRQLRPADGR